MPVDLAGAWRPVLVPQALLQEAHILGKTYVFSAGVELRISDMQMWIHMLYYSS